ncbi:LysM peptidoglycan-binding domain-containing protein [Bradyrhizobium sp. CCGUVB1N3]|uniref:LysM peptidoglycan-binding domain-containing protein n=1 Tax=Bradyrhizobium sp. CCGUVB1N3 TaxID=2949629 RepID=UPI0020B3C4D3|nr:LysM peptidoglycan-binding domain-containing protein [Bradyrhizobium sp. CCGUVB1N3]MCP3476236.1 LysM peptidoglycan-binding domain-containing protein [Bradyrhizobium sp. CCGUVB1N3]
MVVLRRTVLLAVGVLLAVSTAVAAASPAKPKKATAIVALPSLPQPAPLPAEAEPGPSPRVYLFRGALGPIFSTGMDRLAERLTEAGFKADVYEFTICRLIAQRAISTYREQPAPVVLIGHSMGGLCSIIFAEMFAEEKIPVSLVITIDPAHATGNVPLNVERFINIYLSDSVLGGGDVVAEPGYRGHYASFDLKQNKRVTHINIEKSEDIHRQIVDMVGQLPRVPAQAQGEPVPLRYLVPGDTLVELWDSGVKLPMRAGDTLERIAAQYHVPVWSLAQANGLSESAPLTAAQDVIIPRHLLPAVPAQAAAAPSKSVR